MHWGNKKTNIHYTYQYFVSKDQNLALGAILCAYPFIACYVTNKSDSKIKSVGEYIERLWCNDFL